MKDATDNSVFGLPKKSGVSPFQETRYEVETEMGEAQSANRYPFIIPDD